MTKNFQTNVVVVIAVLVAIHPTIWAVIPTVTITKQVEELFLQEVPYLLSTNFYKEWGTAPSKEINESLGANFWELWLRGGSKGPLYWLFFLGIGSWVVDPKEGTAWVRAWIFSCYGLREIQEGVLWSVFFELSMKTKKARILPTSFKGVRQ